MGGHVAEIVGDNSGDTLRRKLEQVAQRSHAAAAHRVEDVQRARCCEAEPVSMDGGDGEVALQCALGVEEYSCWHVHHRRALAHRLRLRSRARSLLHPSKRG